MNALQVLKNNKSLLNDWFANEFQDFWGDITVPVLSEDLLKTFQPKCQLEETSTEYSLKVDLPGVKKEDVKIDLTKDRISIFGERKEEKKTEDKKSKTCCCEVKYGSFSRSIYFPTPVNVEKTEAKFEHGVLSIQAPKDQATPTKQLSIK